MRWWWAVPAAVVGALAGVAALVVHRHAVYAGPWPLPWGAALGVAAPFAVAVGLRREAPALVGFVGGWLLALLVALSEGPGGDFLLLADPLGWGFLAVSLLMVVVAVVVGGVAHRRGEETVVR
jgi:hypothetical protein